MKPAATLKEILKPPFNCDNLGVSNGQRLKHLKVKNGSEATA